MAYVLGIDPGKKATGWAIVHNGEFKVAGLSRINTSSAVKAAKHHAKEICSVAIEHNPDSIILEVPQVFVASGKGNPAHLVDLALLGGYIIGFLAPAFPKIVIKTVLPQEWKGSIPKDVHHRRLLKEMDSKSRKKLETCLDSAIKSLQHNIIDAYGLALYGCNNADTF